MSKATNSKGADSSMTEEEDFDIKDPFGEEINDEDEMQKKNSPNKNPTSRQTEYEFLKTNGFCLNFEMSEDEFEKLEPSENHTVMFDHFSIKYEDHVGPPAPIHNSQYVDEWNDNYVKLPFSPNNLDDNNQPLWKEITRCLNTLAHTLTKDPDSIHIEYAIKKINNKYKNHWNFNALHYLFNEELEGRKGETILKELIPKMIKLALDLPNKICKPIPLLKAGRTHAVSLTQQQCASILANAFFCTFPERDYKHNPENMPYINFNGLYGQSKSESKRVSRKIEKIKCLLHYFKRVTEKMPEGVVTFKRQYVPEDQIPNFRESRKQFRKSAIKLDGTIEDCCGALQMDFANKFLGGGVLNSGCVQEEIRFSICPELMVSMLFTECLNDTESVLIRGIERFSSYTGYGDSFEWFGDYVDYTARDQYTRMYTDILVLDALYFRYPKAQFNESKIVRELKKCFSGFKTETNPNTTNSLPVNHAAIATGNWGCGAFNGNRQLKFLIQLMVAAETDRDLVYFTFNDEKTVKSLKNILKIINDFQLTVGQVYNLINEYAMELDHLDKSDVDTSDFGLSQFLQVKFSD